MEKKYTKAQRRAIYEQMAIDFEIGTEYMGLCKAFSKFLKEINSSYQPNKLILVFPELEDFFGKKTVDGFWYINDEDGKADVYGNFDNLDYAWFSNEAKAIRVSVLTLCAEMCK